jgi:hypothetical protein
MKIIFFIATLSALIINAFYYLQIRREKSFKEFGMNFFNWATIIMIKNNGADRYRKKYMKINNYCMLIFWLSLLMQLLLLFVTDKKGID